MLASMPERAAVVPVTLCFVRSGDHVLLLRIASHKDRFPGCWNGVGGHVRTGEDVRAAVAREIREETGLEPRDLRLRAVIHETGLVGRSHLLFVFTAGVEKRDALRESHEGKLAWFELSALPWTELVPDLRTLLPRVLEAPEPLFGVQHFDGGDRSLALEIG